MFLGHCCAVAFVTCKPDTVTPLRRPAVAPTPFRIKPKHITRASELSSLNTYFSRVFSSKLFVELSGPQMSYSLVSGPGVEFSSCGHLSPQLLAQLTSTQLTSAPRTHMLQTALYSLPHPLSRINFLKSSADP